jgi:UDP-N-acetylglucosamine 2-epimerase (non-hydrolysing)
MKVTIVAGARPNFMKISPIIDALNKESINKKRISYRLVHTGQHYDKKMSKSFFLELEIPEPHINLNCGGGSQSEQTANIMIEFENELLENPCDLVIVVGDVNSTMACAIVSKKLNIKVAHVEAGIRSGDISMPEEINRIVTDSICDYFFTTSKNANNHLIKAGISVDKIFFVGNTMIDTLLKHRHRFTIPEFWSKYNLSKESYIVLTLHRPSNVDEITKLDTLLEEIVKSTNGLKIIFPIHPRTHKVLNKILSNYKNLLIVEPQSYLKFNYLVSNSKCVITDSGGITEETTVLGIPCLTLRDSTERPETIDIGTNILIGSDYNLLKNSLKNLFDGKWKKGGIPQFWDGKTSERIVKILQRI